MAEFNKILSGRFDGYKLTTLNGRVFISGIQMSSDPVESVTMVGTTASGSRKDYVSTFGTTGAVLSNGMKDHVLEITWKNGEKSIATCDDEMAQLVLATPYKSAMTSDQIQRAKESEQNLNVIQWVMYGVIGFIWLLSYLSNA